MNKRQLEQRDILHDDNAVRRVARKFLADIPREALREGRWPVSSASNLRPNEPPAQRSSAAELLAETYPVRDGAYRVDGSDWIFRFAEGRLVEVEPVRPPDYGGPDVKYIFSAVNVWPTTAGLPSAQ